MEEFISKFGRAPATTATGGSSSPIKAPTGEGPDFTNDGPENLEDSPDLANVGDFLTVKPTACRPA